jgi:hypothetical protein
VQFEVVSDSGAIEVKAKDSKGVESEIPASLQVNVRPTNDPPAGGLGASFLINQRVW